MSIDEAGAKREEMEKELRTLTQRMETLRKNYDRFFMGLEKVPPGRERDSLARALRSSKLQRARNTGIKFRYNNLTQRFASYNRNWERQMRMREEGRREGAPTRTDRSE